MPIRMTEERDKWRKYVHGVATLGSRTAEEQNRMRGHFAAMRRTASTDKQALTKDVSIYNHQLPVVTRRQRH